MMEMPLAQGQEETRLLLCLKIEALGPSGDHRHLVWPSFKASTWGRAGRPKSEEEMAQEEKEFEKGLKQ